MPFKILSLDGGGIRGAISARILQEVEQQVWEVAKQPLHEYFDMIAGTSTGSILAAGIAIGKSSEELLDLYRKKGQEIFPYQKLWSAKRLKLLLKYGLSAPKYSHDGLIEALKEQFRNPDGSDIKISEIKHPFLLIPAYDTLHRNTTFFTNYHPLWQICVSSSSAPTFFPGYKLEWTPQTIAEGTETWRFPHVDGGVAANNPTLCAISQALKQKHSPLENISVLSIGTGETTKPFTIEQIEAWGLLDWARRIVPVFMGGQSEIDSTICQYIMGGLESQRYLRLQFELNDIFGEPKNKNNPRPLLPPDKRVNKYTKKKVSEAIDDATKKNIEQLISTAEAFIEKGYTYETCYDQGPKVKDAIKNFIETN
jgi:hypothetical protein